MTKTLFKFCGFIEGVLFMIMAGMVTIVFLAKDETRDKLLEEAHERIMKW